MAPAKVIDIGIGIEIDIGIDIDIEIGIDIEIEIDSTNQLLTIRTSRYCFVLTPDSRKFGIG